MRPFDLQQALAGAPLICRRGIAATNFREAEVSPDEIQPAQSYRFDVESYGQRWDFYCTAAGECLPAPDCSEMDLFMRGEVGET